MGKVTRYAAKSLLSDAQDIYSAHWALCKHCLSGHDCPTEAHIQDDIRKIQNLMNH